MNEIRLSKDMKSMLLYLVAYDDTSERMASHIHNEFVENPTELPDSKLVKDTIRLLKHCGDYWGVDLVEPFITHLNEIMAWADVKVTA